MFVWFCFPPDLYSRVDIQRTSPSIKIGGETILFSPASGHHAACNNASLPQPHSMVPCQLNEPHDESTASCRHNGSMLTQRPHDDSTAPCRLNGPVCRPNGPMPAFNGSHADSTTNGPISRPNGSMPTLSGSQPRLNDPNPDSTPPYADPTAPCRLSMDPMSTLNGTRAEPTAPYAGPTARCRLSTAPIPTQN